MHTLVRLAARFWRWLFLLGREVRVHKHRALPTTQYLTTQFEE